MATTFCVRLAGLPVDVEAQFPSTRAFCRDYLTDKAGEFSVSLTPATRQRERGKAASDMDGWVTEEYLETLALCRAVAEEMPVRNTVLFHGSAIAVDGTAYLFAAPSGTGKSTHAALWRRLLGSRAVMVNDDKPLLRILPESVFACGSPWDGKHHLSAPVEVRLGGICFLRQGRDNRICPLSPRQALPRLMGQVYRPAAPEALERTVDLMLNLCQRVPAYELTCNMEPEAAALSFSALTGQKPPESVKEQG